ncbi:hypothetical protein Tco_0036504, partial [Tanacetum coccineum]
DSEPVQEEIDVFLVPGDLIPPGIENDDSEDEDNSTFLPKNESSILEPSSPRPPLEPPDVCLNFKPDTAMKNDEDFNQGEIVLSLNVEDVNSFTFVIWTFLPSFNYPEDSPVDLSFSRLIPNFLKTLVFGVLSRFTRASYPLFAISLGKSDILSSYYSRLSLHN